MILFDDIMLFLCLDAKETKIKGVKNFILNAFGLLSDPA